MSNTTRLLLALLSFSVSALYSSAQHLTREKAYEQIDNFAALIEEKATHSQIEIEADLHRFSYAEGCAKVYTGCIKREVILAAITLQHTNPTAKSIIISNAQKNARSCIETYESFKKIWETYPLS